MRWLPYRPISSWKGSALAFDLSERASGILLHPTSLPGPHGNGDLGGARAFAELLRSAGQRCWQMLPIGPVGYGDSPYSAQSAFAGSPLLIGLAELAQEGLLAPGDLAGAPRFPEERVDYSAAAAFRGRLLRKAFAGLRDRRALDAYTEEQRSWLDDFALFRAIKLARNETSWVDWEPELRSRSDLSGARRALADEVAFHSFEQWIFDRQWQAFKAHCDSIGLKLIGDIPIFVAHDSADVWAHPELFFLEPDGRPTVISGVPPDYFSATGQRWGNPLYQWAAMAKDGYRWWVERVATSLQRFDALRLDHFIGFVRYWEIPAGEATAIHGRWRPGPGAPVFEAIRRTHGSLPLIAEDLGLVTPEVTALRKALGLPGLKILQFAFGTDPQAPTFKPHNYERECVAYTGTHDNDTTVGWFFDTGERGGTRSPEQCEAERRNALAWLGTGGREIHWEMIRELFKSVASLAVVPAQDVLGLGSEARLNRPGTASGNWGWRLRPGAFDPGAVERLSQLSRIYDRWSGSK